MSKRFSALPFFLKLTAGLALPTTALIWAYPPGTGHLSALQGVIAAWVPFAATASVWGAIALRWRLRKPDVVIVVTARPTPLEAKFLEQDRRLEKRERLRGEVFRNESEIETFVADLTPDERKAWRNRPGPYGK